MRYGIDAERALGPLAEMFLRQVKGFGTVLLGNDWFKDAHEAQGAAIERYKRHLKVVMQFFHLLERACDLRCDDAETVLYNTFDWPWTAGPDGRSDGTLEVRPSQLLVSYWGAWELQQGGLGSMVTRVTRAALWECQTRGLAAAVQYVLDLEKDGYVLHPLVTASVLLELLAARSQVGEHALVAYLLDGARALPGDLKSFMECGVRRRSEKSVSVEGAEREVAIILNHASRSANVARNAKSYTEWWLAQCYLNSHLAGIRHLFKHVEDARSLALSTLLLQLEEIRCDAGATVLQDGPLRARYYMASAVLKIYELNGVKDGVARAMRERAVVVPALLPFLLGQTAEPPPEWRSMAPLMATIVEDVVGGGRCALEPLVEQPGHTASDSMADLDEWLATVSAPVGGAIPVEQVGAILSRYPWNANLWLEMAIARDMLEEDREEALRCVTNALLLNPELDLAWDSLAVILKKTGNLHEAAITRLFSDWLKSREHDSPAPEAAAPD